MVLSFTPTADATLALEAGPYDAANRIGIVPAAGDICLIQARCARCSCCDRRACQHARTCLWAWAVPVMSQDAPVPGCVPVLRGALTRLAVGRADKHEREAACCSVV